MPVYHVTGPDGSTYEVNAPDGATEQDAIAYAQSNLAPKNAQQTPAQQAPQPSMLDRAGDAISQVYKDVNDFGNNLGDSFAHHVASVPVGIAQLGMHLAKGAGDLVSPSQPTMSGLITGK